MKTGVWVTCCVLTCAAGARAGMKPVSYRLASLPASAEQGQKLVLCAANIGTGTVDVSLEFINVKTGLVVAETTVTLPPLGAGAGTQPCLNATADSVAAAPNAGTPHAAGAMESAFTSNAAATPAGDGQAVVVGVAMVRKPLLSFREAQVTASIQVLAPVGNGVMRTVETIPLSRTTHPSDGAPVYAPAGDGGGHHK